MTAWGEWEHLPTRKQVVRFNGTNAAEIVALVNDPRRAWLGELGELIVMFGQGELTAKPGDYVIRDGRNIYPCPTEEFERQYRLVLAAEPVGERS